VHKLPQHHVIYHLSNNKVHFNALKTVNPRYEVISMKMCLWLLFSLYSLAVDPHSTFQFVRIMLNRSLENAYYVVIIGFNLMLCLHYIFSSKRFNMPFNNKSCNDNRCKAGVAQS